MLNMKKGDAHALREMLKEKPLFSMDYHWTSHEIEMSLHAFSDAADLEELDGEIVLLEAAGTRLLIRLRSDLEGGIQTELLIPDDREEKVTVDLDAKNRKPEFRTIGDQMDEFPLPDDDRIPVLLLSKKIGKIKGVVGVKAARVRMREKRALPLDDVEIVEA